MKTFFSFNKNQNKYNQIKKIEIYTYFNYLFLYC